MLNMPRVKPYPIKRRLLETLEGYLEARRIRGPIDLLLFPKKPRTIKPYDERRKEREENTKSTS